MSELIKMKYTDDIKAIDKQIEELRHKRYVLEKDNINDFQERAKVNIGRCFKDENGDYFRIVDVPQREYTKDTHWYFHEFQYPAIHLINDNKMRLTNEIVPFEEDKVYIGCRVEDDLQEVDQAEFEKEFEKKIQEFRECVLGRQPESMKILNLLKEMSDGCECFSKEERELYFNALNKHSLSTRMNIFDLLEQQNKEGEKNDY